MRSCQVVHNLLASAGGHGVLPAPVRGQRGRFPDSVCNPPGFSPISTSRPPWTCAGRRDPRAGRQPHIVAEHRRAALARACGAAIQRQIAPMSCCSDRQKSPAPRSRTSRPTSRNRRRRQAHSFYGRRLVSGKRCGVSFCARMRSGPACRGSSRPRPDGSPTKSHSRR
jgi:hypothetical protein